MYRLRLSKQCVISEVKAFFSDQNRCIHMYLYTLWGETGYPWPVEGLDPFSDTRSIPRRKHLNWRRNLGRCLLLFVYDHFVVYIRTDRRFTRGDGNEK